MPTPTSEVLEIRCEADIVAVRQCVRAKVSELKFSLIDQTKFVTAASEIARNTLIHGLGGKATVETLNVNGRPTLTIRFQDSGPGIADIELALSDGYTSKNGLGLGLGGSKRLVKGFEIKSNIDEGTTVTLTHWK